MTTFVLDRSASNYVPSRETPLQERSHKMPLRQKCDAKAQTSYWRGAYSKMCAALEARIKHNTLESAFVILKQKAGSYLALSYVPFVPLVPFQVLLIPSKKH